MFVIREKNTGAFCTGQRFRSFSMDMQSAAQFVSRTNAEKAMKGMFRGDRNGQQYNIWTIDDQRYHPNVQAYVDQCTKTNAIEMADAVRDTYTQKTCDMEIVEVKLILVDN